MKQDNRNPEIKAQAKEAASKWKDGEKEKQILQLFESGYHLRDIRDMVFPDWGANLNRDDKYLRKLTLDYIVLGVLDCEDWDEYTRKQTKLRNQRKKAEMK